MNETPPWPAGRLRPEKNEHGVPNRAFVPNFTEAELAIRDAVRKVEAMGGSVALTAAVRLLTKAQDCVADHVEGNGHYDGSYIRKDASA